jgi:hypothetical protein
MVDADDGQLAIDRGRVLARPAPLNEVAEPKMGGPRKEVQGRY